MMKWKIFLAVGFVVSLLVVLNSASAQNIAATLRGTARDRQGAVISGANVTVLNPATGVKRTAVTNKSGDYVVSHAWIEWRDNQSFSAWRDGLWYHGNAYAEQCFNLQRESEDTNSLHAAI